MTVFPATLFNPKSARTERTPNFDVLTRSADKLRGMGFQIAHINASGANATVGFKLVAREGRTEAEPDHAVTGRDSLGLRSLSCSWCLISAA
jgi:hypothetical protein